MLGRLLRRLGLRVHVWRTTHPSGGIRECIHCGEERQEYIFWVTGPETTWWETTRSGDGSCDQGSPELPTRIM